MRLDTTKCYHSRGLIATSFVSIVRLELQWVGPEALKGQSMLWQAKLFVGYLAMVREILMTAIRISHLWFDGNNMHGGTSYQRNKYKGQRTPKEDRSYMRKKKKEQDTQILYSWPLLLEYAMHTSWKILQQDCSWPTQYLAHMYFYEWMWRGESSDRDIPVIEASAWLLDPSPVSENFLLRFATAWQEDSVHKE